MTESTPTTCHIDDLPKKPAASKACGECPWRQSNQDRPHPTDQYGQENVTRIWRSVAVEGDFFGCHLLDADYQHLPPGAREAGYKQPADIGARRECAGAVGMIQREMDIGRQYPNHAEYIKDRPVGLSARAFSILQERLAGRLEPELRFVDQPENPDLFDPMERVNTDSLRWKLSTDGLANLLITGEAITGTHCDCDVCAHHTEVHPAKHLAVTGGGSVGVDTELHELLVAMNEAGITTISSCQNIADAMERLAPDLLGPRLRAPAGAMNYRTTIERRAAYIRFNNSSTAGQAFTTLAAKLPGVEVTGYRITTQVSFLLSSGPDLVDLARNIAIAKKQAPAAKGRKAPRRPTDHKPKRKGRK